MSDVLLPGPRDRWQTFSHSKEPCVSSTHGIAWVFQFFTLLYSCLVTWVIFAATQGLCVLSKFCCLNQHCSACFPALEQLSRLLFPPAPRLVPDTWASAPDTATWPCSRPSEASKGDPTWFPVAVWPPSPCCLSCAGCLRLLKDRVWKATSCTAYSENLDSLKDVKMKDSAIWKRWLIPQAAVRRPCPLKLLVEVVRSWRRVRRARADGP